MNALITLADPRSPEDSFCDPSLLATRPFAPSVYRRRRILATLVVALFVFFFSTVGGELLARFHGTPGSTPVGAVGVAGPEVVYVVQPGDTLWEIALRMNLPGTDVRPFVDRLIDVVGTSTLQPGQRIVLPADW